MIACRKKDMLILQMGGGQVSLSLFTSFYTHTDQVVVDVVDWPILNLSLEFKRGVLLRQVDNLVKECFLPQNNHGDLETCESSCTIYLPHDTIFRCNSESPIQALDSPHSQWMVRGRNFQRGNVETYSEKLKQITQIPLRLSLM